MNKKRFLAILLVSVIVFAYGCKKDNDNVAATGYEIWSAPSTVKILQNNVNFSDKKPAELNFKGVRGETESLQLLISAKGSDIDSYYLAAKDITDAAGNVIIEKEDVEIYNEWYVELALVSTNSPLGPGSYPDALIPIDMAKEAGELVAKKGNNAALWITIKIPYGIDAGTYNSTFELSIENDKHQIPVQVKVYDYDISKSTHMRTLFVNRESVMGISELNSTLPMREAYYDFFLDYRVNLGFMPTDSLDPTSYAAAVKKYAEDERVNTYTLPYSTKGFLSLNPSAWTPIVLKLIEESTSELNLLDKLCFYFVDEPEGNGAAGVASAVATYAAYARFLEDLVIAVNADTTGKYDNFKAAVGSDWQEYIRKLNSVATFQFSADPLFDKVSIWCPQWGFFQTEDQVASNLAAFEQYSMEGAELWWYGCDGPKTPWPTFHIEDNLITSRGVNWVAQKYGITGNLYWGVSSASDVYTNPYHTFDYMAKPAAALPAGEGYLVYPGIKYGHFGPLPSMRLMSARDGMEEYELLLALENEYAKFEDKYSIALDSKGIVAQLYSRMHSTTRINTDINLFDEVRGILLDTIAEVSQPHGFIIQNTAILDNKATITMYADSSKYTLSVEGIPLTPVGNKFICVLDLSKFSTLDIVITSKTDASEKYNISKFISGELKMINSFDSDAVLTAVKTNDGNTVAMNSDAQYAVSGSSLKAIINSCITGNDSDDMYYKPYFKISAEALGGVNFAEATTLKFELFNQATNASYKVKVRLTYQNNYVQLGEITVPSGAGIPGKVTASFDLGAVNWTNLSKTDGIEFVFENAGTAEDPASYTIYIDNMYVEKIAR